MSIGPKYTPFNLSGIDTFLNVTQFGPTVFDADKPDTVVTAMGTDALGRVKAKVRITKFPNLPVNDPANGSSPYYYRKVSYDKLDITSTLSTLPLQFDKILFPILNLPSNHPWRQPYNPLNANGSISLNAVSVTLYNANLSKGELTNLIFGGASNVVSGTYGGNYDVTVTPTTHGLYPLQGLGCDVTVSPLSTAEYTGTATTANAATFDVTLNGVTNTLSVPYGDPDVSYGAVLPITEPAFNMTGLTNFSPTILQNKLESGCYISVEMDIRRTTTGPESLGIGFTTTPSKFEDNTIRYTCPFATNVSIGATNSDTNAELYTFASSNLANTEITDVGGASGNFNVKKVKLTLVRWGSSILLHGVYSTRSIGDANSGLDNVVQVWSSAYVVHLPVNMIDPYRDPIFWTIIGDTLDNDPRDLIFNAGQRQLTDYKNVVVIEPTAWTASATYPGYYWTQPPLGYHSNIYQTFSLDDEVNISIKRPTNLAVKALFRIKSNNTLTAIESSPENDPNTVMYGFINYEDNSYEFTAPGINGGLPTTVSGINNLIFGQSDVVISLSFMGGISPKVVLSFGEDFIGMFNLRETTPDILKAITTITAVNVSSIGSDEILVSYDDPVGLEPPVIEES